MPDLGDLTDNRDLYLAFLLGYFDGDGTQGTSKITSSSHMFLYQIRKMFGLDSKIKKKANCYKMFLTADLFNEMLDNYEFSLKRKRIRLIDSISLRNQLMQARQMRQIKFKFSKEDLKDLLLKMPITEIVKLHKSKFRIVIGRTTVYHYAEKWKIKRPDNYYWSGKRFLGNLNDYI